jgi:hypothetical protein
MAGIPVPWFGGVLGFADPELVVLGLGELEYTGCASREYAYS